MLPLILSLTLVLGAGSLVYAMRARREMLELAARAQGAWLAVDQALCRRDDLVAAAIEKLGDSQTEPTRDVVLLKRALESQARVRGGRDLLRLGSYERQIRTLCERVPRAGEGEESDEIASLGRQILALTDAYDSLASLYNIRVQRLPTRLVAKLDGLQPLALIEFVEPFGPATDSNDSSSASISEC